MDNSYRFGRLDVICEGYDYPDDPYILQGSCGLEYTLEYTEEGKYQGPNRNNKAISNDIDRLSRQEEAPELWRRRLVLIRLLQQLPAEVQLLLRQLPARLLGERRDGRPPHPLRRRGRHLRPLQDLSRRRPEHRGSTVQVILDKGHETSSDVEQAYSLSQFDER